MDDNAIHFNVSQWFAWSPGLESKQDWRAWTNGSLVPMEEGVPSLPFLKPMLRRRLSQLSKMSVKVAFECLGTESAGRVMPDRTVFCSRHGELHRTVGLLESLIQQQELSPTGFSLSVHNAASGLYSIAANDTQPSISLAAGRDTLMEGVREAAMLIHAGDAKTVLLVIADEPLPPHLIEFADEQQCSAALGLLLTAPQTCEQSSSTNVSVTPSTERVENDGVLEPQLFSFLRFFLSQENECTMSGARGCWKWARHV